MMQTISLRDHLGECLLEVCGQDERVFVLDGDLAKSTGAQAFALAHPERFLEMGISETSAMSAAQGLALEGKIPFNINFSIFVTGLAWNQLRQICYAGDNVKLIGTHPGMDNGPDGASHHANEDLALARVLPGLVTLIPASLAELRTAIRLAYEHRGPVYIRVSRDLVPQIDEAAFQGIGEAVVTASHGDDLLLIYEGSASLLAHEAFPELAKLAIGTTLMNIGSLKPLDRRLLLEKMLSHTAVMTLENHSMIGGLGSAIAEFIVAERLKLPLATVGVNDCFTESGKTKDVKEKYGLSVATILAEAEKLPRG